MSQQYDPYTDPGFGYSCHCGDYDHGTVPERIVCAACKVEEQKQQLAAITQERDALREENTRLRKYIGVMDAALKIPDGASTTGERCKRTNSLIGSDDWMEEPACSCVVCIDHVLTPSGEAGKGGEV